ncbi:MAG: hypothetical protein ACK4YF_02545 [Exilispira sp.]
MKKSYYKTILIFILIFLFLIIVDIKIYSQNLKVRYYEIWNKYTLLQFYNEISKENLKSYNFYYIVTYDFKGRILKFEYIVNSKVDFQGEVAFFDDNHATITLKKLETQLMATQPVLVPYAMYEIVINNGLISSYVLYKVSPNLEKPVKIGDARFTYKDNLTIIENIFNDKVIMRIEIIQDDQNIYEMQFYNDKNLLIEKRIFVNNKLSQRIVYKYDSNGKLIQIITYDATGQIISTENK